MRKGFFQQQVRQALEQEKHALLLATVLAAIPYVGWLSLVLMALVTLRHGARAGFKLFLPVSLVYVLVSVFTVSLSAAVMSIFLNVLPCYLAAYTLRTTSSWRAVSVVLLGGVVIGTTVIQFFSPDFILQQYAHLETAIRTMASSQTNALEFWTKQGVSTLVLANCLLGIQAVSVVFSAIMPLLFARSLQSQLFYPGGFREEMLHFRGDKTSFAVLMILLVAVYFERFLGINSLPLVLFYFILAGLSLCAYAFSNLRPLALMLLLIVPMIFLSWVILPLYVLLGAFDSLFNFRLYLSAKAGKAT
ncbi:MAG: hypothetical protein K0U37_08885 [Gammaproteobacteria bacterium]|nr:hypothetical protein [Gammaproteobacteria bacterium]